MKNQPELYPSSDSSNQHDPTFFHTLIWWAGNGKAGSGLIGRYCIIGEGGTTLVPKPELSLPPTDIALDGKATSTNQGGYVVLQEALDALGAVLAKTGHALAEVELTLACNHELVINQLAGVYKVRDANLIPLYQQTMARLSPYRRWKAVVEPHARQIVAGTLPDPTPTASAGFKPAPTPESVPPREIKVKPAPAPTSSDVSSDISPREVGMKPASAPTLSDVSSDIPPEWVSVLQAMTPRRWTQTPGSYVAYTDGCCLRNPGGAAGWGLTMRYLPAGRELEPGEPEAEVREWFGHIPPAPATTNNRAEITALLAALYAVPDGARLHIHSDSQYALKVAQGTYAMKANPDLWQLYRGLSARRQLTFTWVRGHVGNLLNERADHLSNLGAFKGDLQKCLRWEEEENTRRTAPRKAAKPPAPGQPVPGEPDAASPLPRLERLQALFDTLPTDDNRADSYARTFVQDIRQRLVKRPDYALSEKQLTYLASLERRLQLL